MSYQSYVIAAYVIFAVVMLWDWLAPKLQIRQQLRAASLRAKRNAKNGDDLQDRHPGESRK